MERIPPPSDGDSPETYHRHRKSNRAAGAAVAAAAALVVCWIRWRPRRVEISGESMAPTLLAGDWALTVRIVTPRSGWVVVVDHPDRPGFEVVKRITAGPGESVGTTTLGEREWWLEGDRPGSSTDSRSFGPVHSEQLLARVVFVYWPPERRRVL